MFSTYFKHRSIIFYYSIIICLGLYLVSTQAIFNHWYIGLILFSAPFFEWAVHKYFLHYEFNFKNKKLKNFFYKVHEGHHEFPNDKELIFAPIIIGLSVPLIFFFLTLLIFNNIDISLTASFFSLLYYCYYEWIHLAHHTDTYIPITTRGKKLKKHHTFHHFKNEHYWWGVTTILGDQIFNTAPTHLDIKKSKTTKSIFSKTLRENTILS